MSNLLAGVAFGLGLDVGGAVNSGRLEIENNGVGLLLKRGGPALIGLCFRSATCQEKVIGPVAFAAISAAVAALRAANRQLDENQALLLAVTRYITTPASMESIPGKSGEPVPPLPIPPGQTGGNENVSVPGKPADGQGSPYTIRAAFLAVVFLSIDSIRERSNVATAARREYRRAYPR